MIFKNDYKDCKINNWYILYCNTIKAISMANELVKNFEFQKIDNCLNVVCKHSRPMKKNWWIHSIVRIKQIWNRYYNFYCNMVTWKRNKKL